MAFDIATEHVLHLADKFENFGTTATKHGRHLITAVSLHCQLSLVPLLQGMVVVFYPQKNSMLEIINRFHKYLQLCSRLCVSCAMY